MQTHREQRGSELFAFVITNDYIYLRAVIRDTARLMHGEAVQQCREMCLTAPRQSMAWNRFRTCGMEMLCEPVVLHFYEGPTWRTRCANGTAGQR